MTSVICRLCKSGEPLFLFTKYGYHIYRCRTCNLIFTAGNFSIKEIKEYYGKDYFLGSREKLGYHNYFAEEETFRLNSRERITEIEKLTNGRSLLDVGCAAGFFLDEARKKGFLVEGLEISEFMADYAGKRFGLRIRKTPFQAKIFRQKYDVITMWDLVEHLDDPVKILMEANKLLQKEGIIAMSTGDVKSLFARICGCHWHLYTPPQHLSFFDNKTIKWLLEKTGFKIVKIDNTGCYYTLSYLSFALKVKFPLFPLNLFYDIIEKTRLARAKIYVNLGDIMTVYARKK